MAYSPFEPYDDLPLLPPGVDIEKRTGRELIYRNEALLKVLIS
jgi:hypothetical protein